MPTSLEFYANKIVPAVHAYFGEASAALSIDFVRDVILIHLPGDQPRALITRKDIDNGAWNGAALAEKLARISIGSTRYGHVMEPASEWERHAAQIICGHATVQRLPEGEQREFETFVREAIRTTQPRAK